MNTFEERRRENQDTRVEMHVMSDKSPGDLPVVSEIMIDVEEQGITPKPASGWTWWMTLLCILVCLLLVGAVVWPVLPKSTVTITKEPEKINKYVKSPAEVITVENDGLNLKFTNAKRGSCDTSSNMYTLCFDNGSEKSVTKAEFEAWEHQETELKKTNRVAVEAWMKAYHHMSQNPPMLLKSDFRTYADLLSGPKDCPKCKGAGLIRSGKDPNWISDIPISVEEFIGAFRYRYNSRRCEICGAVGKVRPDPYFSMNDIKNRPLWYLTPTLTVLFVVKLASSFIWA